MKTYNRLADVEFALPGTGMRITIRNLPFMMSDTASLHTAEMDAVFDAIKTIRGAGVEGGLDLVSVCSSPAPTRITTRS